MVWGVVNHGHDEFLGCALARGFGFSSGAALASCGIVQIHAVVRK